jgi:hypothetical protein
LAGACLPGVGGGAAFGEGLVFGSGRAAKRGLRFRTDGGGNGDDAGDVGGAVGVEDAGVGLRWLLLGREKSGGCEDYGRKGAKASHDWIRLTVFADLLLPHLPV